MIAASLPRLCRFPSIPCRVTVYRVSHVAQASFGGTTLAASRVIAVYDQEERGLRLPIHSHHEQILQYIKISANCLHQLDLSPSLESGSFRSPNTAAQMPKVTAVHITALSCWMPNHTKAFRESLSSTLRVMPVQKRKERDADKLESAPEDTKSLQGKPKGKAKVGLPFSSS